MSKYIIFLLLGFFAGYFYKLLKLNSLLLGIFALLKLKGNWLIYIRDKFKTCFIKAWDAIRKAFIKVWNVIKKLFIKRLIITALVIAPIVLTSSKLLILSVAELIIKYTNESNDISIVINYLLAVYSISIIFIIIYLLLKSLISDSLSKVLKIVGISILIFLSIVFLALGVNIKKIAQCIISIQKNSSYFWVELFCSFLFSLILLSAIYKLIGWINNGKKIDSIKDKIDIVKSIASMTWSVLATSAVLIFGFITFFNNAMSKGTVKHHVTIIYSDSSHKKASKHHINVVYYNSVPKHRQHPSTESKKHSSPSNSVTR